MDPNKEAQFQAILGRSRSLMNMVEAANPSSPRGKSAPAQSYSGGGGSVNVGKLGSVELDYEGDGIPDKQYLDANHRPIDSNSFSSRYNPESSDLEVNAEMATYAMQNSSLGPIFQAIAENPANPVSEDYNGSVLDRLGIPKPKPRRQMTESIQYQQQAPAQIDYSLIRTIFAEQVSEMKKSILSEVANTKQIDNVIALTVGKDKSSFRMVTAEGKIYNISMEYVGDMKKDK